jgi:hypothetical protein
MKPQFLLQSREEFLAEALRGEREGSRRGAKGAGAKEREGVLAEAMRS